MERYLDYFKSFTNFSYIHAYCIIHVNTNKQNILYLPNIHKKQLLLGKWNSKWFETEKFILGFLEQDDKQNVQLIIVSSFSIKHKKLESITIADFNKLFKECYKPEPFLQPIFIECSSEYFEASKELPKTNLVVKELPKTKEIVDELPQTKEIVNDIAKTNLVVKEVHQTKEIVKDIAKTNLVVKEVHQSDTIKQQKIKNIELTTNKKLVCKTDKPDVYHVFDSKKNFLASCLIPSMKISHSMAQLFEEKSIGEMVELCVEYHEITKKYLPIF